MATVTGGETLTGSVSVAAGSDDIATEQFTYNSQTKNIGNTITGSAGNLTVNSNRTWSFAAADVSSETSTSWSYKATDTDGDVTTKSLSVTVESSGPNWDNPQQQKIQSSDIEANDRFGCSVSISADGNTAIVGSYLEDTGSSNAGAAYIFTRSGGTWTQQQKIQASDAQSSDLFGFSVSISSDGNNAIIGANLEDTGGLSAGAAYIFTRSGSTWTQQQKIQASDKDANDNFGRSVSISADGTAIVGAYAEDTGGSSAGAAYIFTRSGSTWTQQQKIQASDAQSSDLFGYSVSISSDGNNAIVGANGEDTGGNSSGSAYIFTRSGSTWTQQQKIQANITPLNATAQFGYSVSISSDGNTVIVGSPYENTATSEGGGAHVFTRSGSTWTEQQAIFANDAVSGDWFGWSVSISSDSNSVIVGASGENSGGGDSGAAYIFTRSGSTWTQQPKLLASDKQAGDLFGHSVSISSEGTAVVGAYEEDTGGSNAGAAYIFAG